MMRTVSITLNCPTMGCVACINKVNSSLQNAKFPASSTATTTGTATPTITSAQSWLLDGDDQKGGQAKIELSLPIPAPAPVPDVSSSSSNKDSYRPTPVVLWLMRGGRVARTVRKVLDLHVQATSCGLGNDGPVKVKNHHVRDSIFNGQVLGERSQRQCDIRKY